MAQGQNKSSQSNIKEFWKRWKDSVSCYTSNKKNKQMYNRMLRRINKQLMEQLDKDG